MPFEMFFPTDNKGKGLLLQEYNERFSIVAAFKPVQGTVKINWGKPEIKGELSEKSYPWKVTLGNHTQSIKLLKSMIAALETAVDESRF